MRAARNADSQSGSQLAFKTRNRQFAAGKERYWYKGDPVITAYFNALSAMFPDGERFFCDTVRMQKHRIGDPKLRGGNQGVSRTGGGSLPRAPVI